MSRKVDELLKLAAKFECKIAQEKEVEVARSQPKLQVWLAKDATKAQQKAMSDGSKSYYTFAPGSNDVIQMWFSPYTKPQPKWVMNDAPSKKWDYATMEIAGHHGMEVMQALQPKIAQDPNQGTPDPSKAPNPEPTREEIQVANRIVQSLLSRFPGYQSNAFNQVAGLTDKQKQIFEGLLAAGNGLFAALGAAK